MNEELAQQVDGAFVKVKVKNKPLITFAGLEQRGEAINQCPELSQRPEDRQTLPRPASEVLAEQAKKAGKPRKKPAKKKASKPIHKPIRKKKTP